LRGFVYILLTGLVFLFSSCEQIVDIDLNDADPRIVIEGVISSKPTIPQYVKVSLTTSYFDTGQASGITDALVIVTEDGALVDTFSHQLPGYYVSNKILSGKVGSTYKLSVYYKGELYEAMSTMAAVAPIDSLTANYRAIDMRYEEAGHYVTIALQEPPGIGNFYYWLYYSNDTLMNYGDMIIASDEMADGVYINNIEFSYPQQPGDTVRVEQYSLSEEGYNFLRILADQEEFGDLFDTPPANIIGNISNNGIGFFSASDVSESVLVIQP